MSAGHANGELQTHQLSQHLGPLDDRNTQTSRLDHLGVVLTHGR